MAQAEFPTLLAFFKAMANESRLRIVGLLAGGERTGQELAGLLDLKEPTVSHHLAVLKDLGLVTSRADGVMRWHALQRDTLTRLNRALLEPRGVEALASGEGRWDAKVVEGYLDNAGKLKAFPASRRKRAIVLAWLMERFEDDRRYPEAEINAAIQQVWWDSATLRRELIGHRMMAREAGVYWRLPRAEWTGLAQA